MKTNPDPNHDDPLLDAILRDDGWQAAHAAGKAEALGVFQARQRLRRLTRLAGSLAALAVAVVCAAHWLATPRQHKPRQYAIQSPPAKPEKSIYLTDAGLLALFPEGSCFLAEVDGKKKLVFLDPQVEREYISDAGAPRSSAP
jgi:hypothetical protein